MTEEQVDEFLLKKLADNAVRYKKDADTVKKHWPGVYNSMQPWQKDHCDVHLKQVREGSHPRMVPRALDSAKLVYMYEDMKIRKCFKAFSDKIMELNRGKGGLLHTTLSAYQQDNLYKNVRDALSPDSIEPLL